MAILRLPFPPPLEMKSWKTSPDKMWFCIFILLQAPRKNILTFFMDTFSLFFWDSNCYSQNILDWTELSELLVSNWIFCTTLHSCKINRGFKQRVSGWLIAWCFYLFHKNGFLFKNHVCAKMKRTHACCLTCLHFSCEIYGERPMNFGTKWLLYNKREKRKVTGGGIA